MTATAAPTTTVADTPTTSTLPPIPGWGSSSDAINAWLQGIVDNDLAAMWSVLDPQVREGVSRSEWDACIAAQFGGVMPDSVEYVESEVYEEDGSLFSTGTGTVRLDGDELSEPVTVQVVERVGGWFVVQTVTRDQPESCAEKAAVSKVSAGENSAANG